MENLKLKFRARDKENEIMICPKGILFDGRAVNFSCGMLEAFVGRYMNDAWDFVW